MSRGGMGLPSGVETGGENSQGFAAGGGRKVVRQAYLLFETGLRRVRGKASRGGVVGAKGRELLVWASRSN